MAVLKHRTSVMTLWALAIFVSGPPTTVAQTLGTPASPGGFDLPEWLTRWSAVTAAGDLVHGLPGGTLAMPSVLTVPAPKLGGFWTGGNPAALPWEVRDSYVQFRFAGREDDGAYRRPLDPGTDARLAGSALGWKALHGSGAAVGRVQAERMRQRSGAFAGQLLPYGSNPFVVLDTLGNDVSALIARLDGAGGWRLGNLGMGLSAGFDGREVRTVASLVPVQYRVSAAGVTGGLNYAVAGGMLRFGGYAHFEQLAQSVQVSGYGADTRVYVLRGYVDPQAVDLAAPNNVLYGRKLARDGHGFGATVSGGVGGIAWAAYVEWGDLAEHQAEDVLDVNPPTDDYDADHWRAGVDVQLPLARAAVLATASGRYRSLSGSAQRKDLTAPHFFVEQTGWEVSADVRVMPAGGWMAAVRLSAGRLHWRADDTLVAVGSNLRAWTPSVALEIARTLPRGFAVALGAGWAQHAPTGTIPDPAELSAAYQRWIAPELSLDATKATTTAASATVRWRLRRDLELWVRGTLGSLSGSRPLAALPAAPQGWRHHRSLAVGMTMREP